MSSDFLDEARRKILGNISDWTQPFNVKNYKSNPRLIEKLYEEKQLLLAENLDLKQKVKELEALKLENQRLSIQLAQAKRQSLLAFFISVLANLLTAIGVNIATGSPDAWTGWTMIVFGVLFQSLTFLAIPR